jgi:hypothetical protein
MFAGLLKFRSSPLHTIFYFVLSADSLRISYNCYVKNYYSIASKKFSEDTGNIANTIISFAQKAVGALVNDDPLKKLKEEVDWQIIFENTFAKYITVLV